MKKLEQQKQDAVARSQMELLFNKVATLIEEEERHVSPETPGPIHVASMIHDASTKRLLMSKCFCARLVDAGDGHPWVELYSEETKTTHYVYWRRNINLPKKEKLLEKVVKDAMRKREERSVNS